MKLVYRILLHLSWALSLLLAAWAVLFYFTLIDEINDEVDDALEARAEVIVKRVLAGRELPVPADEGNNGYFLHEVSPQYAAAQHHERYSDEEIFIPERDDKEPARVLRKVFRDGAGQWRELTVMTPTIEKDDLRESILRWMVCLYLFLLLMILLGYLLRLGNFWDNSFFRQLNRFCFRVFLPVQLFLNVYSVGSLSELNWVLLVYIIGGILFSMALGILVAHLTAKRRAQRAVIAQATFRSNQVILGVPLASALGGASAMAFASLVTSVCVPVFNVLAVLVLTMYASGSPGAAGWKTRLMNIAKNPLILGACTGLVVVAIRGLLPTGADGTPVFTLQSSLPSLFSVLQQFSKVATPIMLVVLGTQIRFDAVRGLLKNLTVAVCMRLIVCPCIILGLAVALRGPLGLTTEEMPSLVAIFCSPVAVTSAVMVQEIGGDEQLAGQIVAWSSVLSMLTIFVFTVVLRTHGLL